MTITKISGLALAGALALVSVAAPASATITTFAQYQAVGSDANLYWKNSGTGNPETTGTSGSLYTVAANGTTPAARLVSFSFLQPQLTFLGQLAANFTFNATASGVATTASNFIFQNNLSGTFSFTNVNAITVGSNTYAAGSNLLSATFNNTGIAGQRNSTSAGVTAATAFGATITYTSDFIDFSSTTDRDFSLSLTSVQSPLNATPTGGTPNRALRTFRGLSTGSFSSDPAPIVTAVPEPASWALMIAGFGMVGLATRRRRRRIVAA